MNPNMNSLIILFCYLLFFQYSVVAETDCPTPFSQCNFGKEEMINVHIVPHTHDDVG